jgi:MFS family permease
MLAWFKELSGQEKKALMAAYGGWSMDAFDFMIYTFLIPTLIAAWGITHGQAGLILTSALLVSSVGGWAAGVLADRWGRVRVLQITVGWFALFTFLSGFTNSFEQLLMTRSMQGLGLGGEWAVGSVMIGEIIRPQHRGKAVGTVQSGWAVGWGVAAILFTVFYTVLPENLAWRALFWVGVLPALLIFYVRKNVQEPEVSTATRERVEEHGGTFLEIFSPALLRTTVLASLMTTGMQGGYYAVTTWLPTFLRTERGLSILDSAGYLAVSITGAFCGYLAGGFLADRVGRRLTFLTFAIGAGAIAVIYTSVPFGNAAMLFLGFPLGFFASGVFSAMGPFFTEHFPTRVRGVGQGFAYNVGRATGALFPTLVGFLSTRISLGHAIGLFAAIAYATMALAAFLLPETRGKVLAAE